MTRIEELARQLIREGHADNEVDARLAAVHILLATESGHRRATNRTAEGR